MSTTYKKYFKNSLSINDDPSIFLLENVLKPENYVKILKEHFLKHKKGILRKNRTPERLCIYLSLLFKKYKIEFQLDFAIKSLENDYLYGVSKGEYHIGKKNKNDIVIVCNSNIQSIQTDERFLNTFLDIVLKIIGHEIIHRLQGLNVKDEELRKKIYSNNTKDIRIYLSNKYEVMSRAWQIIEELRFQGVNDSRIKEIIKNSKNYGMSASLYEYRRIFSDNQQEVLNLLYKYVFLYLEGIND
jgi:hypothetical protein